MIVWVAMSMFPFVHCGVTDFISLAKLNPLCIICQETQIDLLISMSMSLCSENLKK